MTTQYDDLIQRAAKEHLPGYDWRLYKAQLWQESRLKPNARSPAGALGIAQFMPATWDEWAPKAGYPDADRTDPEASIMTGAAYMDYLINAWYWQRPLIDRHCLALASYNAGKGNLIKAQQKAGNPVLYSEIIKGLPEVTREHSRETTNYVQKILAFYNAQVLRGSI